MNDVSFISFAKAFFCFLSLPLAVGRGSERAEMQNISWKGCFVTYKDELNRSREKVVFSVTMVWSWDFPSISRLEL